MVDAFGEVISIPEEAGDIQTVISLLTSWGVSSLILDFANKGIDLEVLKCLTVDDINRLIPDDKFGLRIKFRQKLFEWKRENGLCTPLAETLSLSINVSNWINSGSSSNYSPISEKGNLFVVFQVTKIELNRGKLNK